MHPGSKDTYDTISDWEPGPIPVSKNNQFGRMGILSVMAYMTLQFAKGAILEIGAGESSVFLGELAKRHNRQAFFVDLQRSVMENALTVPNYFGRPAKEIRAGQLTDISPEANVYIGSSDEFFNEANLCIPIAFAFIDGEHTYECAKKDLENVLPLLEETGMVAMHDTYPPSKEFTHVARCGTVYKLRQEIEKRDDLDVYTCIRGAMDVGLTIIRKKKTECPEYQK